MRKRIIVVMAVVLIAATGSAVAAAPSPKLAKKYLHIYTKVVKVQGKRAPGRNIIRWGFAPGRPATAAQVRKSIGILRRMLVPLQPTTSLPAAPTQSTSYRSTQVRQSSAQPASGTGGGGGSFAACIRQHENGGSYTDNQPDSGGPYSGAYQFDRSTWAAAWGGNPPTARAGDASPAQQDEAFQRYYPGHHSAWPTTGPACGG